ncbi:CoA transferase [Novosphingobium tardum]|uniref:CoA transferase n=1 Tax=Novosphingobium tardum TaxID=1538021 RepID=A0ABV8RNJ5_9SPHN
MYDLLSGLTVIEASSFVASPTAGLYCAQMGADVIRVDQIGGGPDFKRAQKTAEGHSLSWENLNRAKRSLALDLGRPEGRELLAELVRATGQFITNFPVSGFLSHDKLSKGCDNLITVRIMGWGDGRQAMDFTVNAAVGYPLMAGPVKQDHPAPINSPVPGWDLMTGAYAAFALLAALRRRDATGRGGEVRIPLGDVAIGSVSMLGGLAEVLYTGRNRERLGNATWGAFGRDFETRDGVLVMLTALTPKQWAALVQVLDLAEPIAALERRSGVALDSDDTRFAQRDELFALFEPAVAARDYADLAAALDAAGATYERYRTTLEAANDPVLVGDNPLFGRPDGPNPSGFDYPAAGPFAALPGDNRGAPRPAPLNGQHSEQVLAERLNLSSGEIARLIDAGIVGTARTQHA